MSEALWTVVLPVAITVIGGGVIAIVHTIVKRRSTIQSVLTAPDITIQPTSTGVFATATSVKNALAKVRALELAATADRFALSAAVARVVNLEADATHLRESFVAFEKERHAIDLRIERELGKIGAMLENAMENDR